MRPLTLLCLLTLLCACSPADESIEASKLVDLTGADLEVRSAILELRAKLSATPYDPGFHGQLGMAYEVNGFADAAMQAYQQAEHLGPIDAQWPYFQALLVAHRGDLKTALDDLARSLALDNDYAPAWLWRGSWLLDTGSPGEAAIAYERAAALDAGMPAVVGQARVALELGEAEQALSLLSPLLPNEAHPFVLKLLAQCYVQLERLDEARQTTAKIHKPEVLRWQDPRSETKKAYEVSVGARLGRARQALNADGSARVKEVLAELVDLRTRHPEHQGLISVLGLALLMNDEPAGALQVLRDGVDLYPDFFAYHVSISDIYISTGNAQRAWPHLDKVIELEAGLSWANAQQGLILLDRGEQVMALQSFRDSLLADPNEPTVNYYAGMVLAAQEDYLAAREYFERAVANDAEFTVAYIGLAQALTEIEEFEAARDALGRAEALATHADDVANAINDLEQRISESP